MNAKGAAYLLLEAGGELFGIDLSLVEAVVPYARPAAVPFQKKETLAALLHRGRFMGVVELGRMVGVASDIEEGRAVIAVMEREGAYVGLAASASHGLLREADIGDEARVIGKWSGPFHLFSARFGGRVAHLIDAGALLEELSGRIERAV